MGLMHEADRYVWIHFQQHGKQASFLLVPCGRLGKCQTENQKKDMLIACLPQKAAQGVFPFQAEQSQSLYSRT